MLAVFSTFWQARLADLAGDENTGKVGPASVLTITMFWYNKRLVLAEHPFI